MKKLLMVCGLLFSVITFANAQGGDRKMPTPEERAQRMTDQLTKKLSLSDDQKTKVLAIYNDQAAQMEKSRGDNKGDREAMKAAREKMMADTDAKLNALFTADQKKAYVALQEERKANMGKMGERRGPGRKGDGTPPPPPAPAN